MDLVIIGGLLAVAVVLLKSLLSPRPEPAPVRRILPSTWHSDYRQLRIEYHQSIDESLSPPKH
jgi:hypothetical protein